MASMLVRASSEFAAGADVGWIGVPGSGGVSSGSPSATEGISWQCVSNTAGGGFYVPCHGIIANPAKPFAASSTSMR